MSTNNPTQLLVDIRELSEICALNGLPLSSEAAALLNRYADTLRTWNAKLNLISRQQDEEHILARHILHSLTLRMPAICDYAFSGKRVADVGTGGGLPGIPMKIVTPSSDMTLIDSSQKKIVACNEMITSLGLTGIRAIAGRAEELAKLPEHAQKYDAVVSRAVASLEDLTKWTHGLIRPGGVLLSLKGGDLAEEMKRTSRLKYVLSIEEKPLEIVGYDAFVVEGKKLVAVRLRD